MISDADMGEDTGMTTVFFSYSRQDRDRALPIIRAIEDAGYSVWWDGMLEGGTAFLDTTETALETAKAVIVLWSRHSINSHWVRDEATSGRDRNRMIPLSLDGSMPPLGFRQVQFIDMVDWHKKSETFDEIERCLAKLHDRDYQPPDRRSIDTRSDAGSFWSRRTAILAGLGLGTIGVGGVLVTSFLRSRGHYADARDIAVLPFTNEAGYSELDYVALGLSAALRDGLARNAALRVVARASSQAVARDNLGVSDMARRLSVGSLIEGRLHKVGDALQITASLVAARSGFTEWSQTFDYDPDKTLDIRDAMISEIFSALSTVSTGAEAGAARVPEAFDAFMKGNMALKVEATLESVQRARQHFERAVSMDPDFLAPHLGLAEVYLVLGVYSSDKIVGADFLDRSEQAARRAVDIAPDYADAHAQLGEVLSSGRLDFKGASAPFERARAIGLTSSDGLLRHVPYLLSTGQYTLAIEQAKKAQQFDPLNAGVAETLGLAYFADEQYRPAIQAYRQALALSPNRFNTRARLGSALIMSGQVEAGLTACAEEENLMEQLPCQAFAATRQDDLTKAQDALDSLIATFGDAAAYQEAQILADMGRSDEAISTLLKAERLKDTGLTLIKFDPSLNSLRPRSDFQDLLVRLGLSD